MLTLVLALFRTFCAFPLVLGATPPAPAAAEESFAEESFAGGSEQPTVTPASLARAIHDEVNAARTARGLAPLTWDPALADIARLHSEDMAAQGFFSHVNPGGQDPTARGLEAGYRCRKEYEGFYTEGVAENLFQSNLYDGIRRITRNGQVVEELYDWNTEADIARATVQGWLESEEHRRNLLEPRFSAEGIGVAIADDDRVYITQNFC